MSEMTPEALREIAGWIDGQYDEVGGSGAFQAQRLYAWASELEGSTQPTRDEVTRVVEPELPWIDFEKGTAEERHEQAGSIVDALIARGWLGVSDTPNEGAG